MRSEFAVAAMLFAILSPARAETYRIAGVVLNAATGRPAPRIRMGLVSTDARDHERSAITGSDGSFVFDGLPAGKHNLTADHPNGARQMFGQPEMAAPGFGMSVVTGPNLKTDAIVFRLFPPSAIHGRVTDQGGDAVEGVLVQLFRVFVARGHRAGYYYGSYRTDDLGEYRFGPLPAGTYYILATGRPWYSKRIDNGEPPSPLERLSYAPTFYPNARDARGAAPLRIQAGQDAVADLAMTDLPAGKLSIILKDAPAGGEGRRGPSARVDITFEGPAGSMGWERVETTYGSADYAGIPQGSYTVRVSTPDPVKPLYSRDTVLVTGGETRLEVSLAPAPAVTGKLTVDGVDGAIPRGTLIELENEAENHHIRRPVEQDGSFSFDNLPPGRYTPILMSPVARMRVGAVAVDGVPAKELALDIPRSLRLEVAGVAHGAEVSGFVYRNGEPQAGVLALLVPQRESLNPYDYMAFETDSDGSFEFEAVTAGDYRILAIEQFAEVEYANPDALKPYLGSAQSVRVERDQKQTVRVELQ